MPINPSGGLKARGIRPAPPGWRSAMNYSNELRGEAENQVDGARVGPGATIWNSAPTADCRRSPSFAAKELTGNP